MPNRTRAVRDRIYADFLMPSRLAAYRQMLETMLASGYSVVSIDRYWRGRGTADSNPSNPPDPIRPTVILRHDIDTDPGTGRRMWEIGHELGIAASFFFRLSTLDVPLMSEIAAGGGHASYHYEEIATVAKRRRLRSRREVDGFLPEIRAEFVRNLAAVRQRTRLPIDIVASHGDFANRRLGTPNWTILTDQEVRTANGIVLEAYDHELMGTVTSRHSDTLHPRYWVGESPLVAVGRREPVVHVLVHPRHWRTAPLTNALDDLGRLRENVAYQLPVRR